jgi:hypothetical protein
MTALDIESERSSPPEAGVPGCILQTWATKEVIFLLIGYLERYKRTTQIQRLLLSQLNIRDGISYLSRGLRRPRRCYRTHSCDRLQSQAIQDRP